MSVSSIAHDLAEDILRRPVPPPPRPVHLPEADEEEPRAAESLGYAEGQSFAIEYIDSKGRTSTRRITVWSIVAGSGGIPCLFALCHERKAQRQFRVDRIRCFIDYDGEVFEDIPNFLLDNFGMSIAVATKKASAEGRWQTILEEIRHDAVLLAALSRSDGKVHRAETEAAADYLAGLAENSGIMLDAAEEAAIGRYAGRLRPDEGAILRALNHLSAQGTRRIQKLLRGAVTVMDADGLRHDSERDLVNAIAIDLTGAPVV